MRSALLALSLAAAAAAHGGLGSGPRPSDGYATNGVSFARRGSLGADDYVVTNLVRNVPCYALVTNAGPALADRTVNRVKLTGDATLAVPPVRFRPECGTNRIARAFVVVTETDCDPPPAVTFSGARRLYTDCGEVEALTGLTLMTFLEIGDGEFIVDCRRIRENQR